MRAIVVFAVVSVLLLPARPGAAQGIPGSLTLSDALTLAASRNPSFAAARDAIEVVQGARAEAARRPNPALTFESQAFESNRRQLPDTGGREFSVRFDQELELGGRRGLRIAAADATVRATESRAQNRLRQLELEVKRAYLQAVLATADRAVAQTSLDEIDRVLGVSRARFQQGEISGAELRRLQVERLRFVDDVFAAELALRNARSALLALIGAPDLGQPVAVVELLAPAGPPPGTPVQPIALAGPALVARALAARADVSAARQEVVRTETETRLQRALRSPAPTVGGGYKRDFSGSAVMFGVTIPVPLFNSLNAGSVARAEAEQRRAANEAAATELVVRLDVQQAANALTINQERVAYIEREYLTPARESRDIAAAAYRIGAADLIDFLDAQRAFRDTARTYNRALYESRVSAFELEAAVGEPNRQE